MDFRASNRIGDFAGVVSASTRRTIATDLSALDASVERLETIVGSLGDRLEPASVIYSKIEGTAIAHHGPPEPAVSTVANRIRLATIRVDKTAAGLQTLLEQVDL